MTAGPYRDVWHKLLRRDRVKFEDGRFTTVPPYGGSDGLNEFLFDTNRIIYTSAFRRLQHKTQVFPFPNTDYVRNRLTHTIEVAQIGYMLGSMVGKWLVEKKELLNFEGSGSFAQPNDIAEIVYNACLLHDIGNPPFGHVGEDAIRSWFIKRRGGDGAPAHLIESKLFGKECISDKYFADFKHFDGNAQSFRVVTRTQGWRQAGGMRLSLAVLGSIVKYPFTSNSIEENKNFLTSKSKFGFFREDLSLANFIFDELGIPVDERFKGGETRARHPLAFLMEAADDIAYHATDIEDAYKSGTISFKEARKLLKPLVDPSLAPNLDMMWERVRKPSPRDPHDDGDRNNYISYLRAGMIETLTRRAFSVFVDESNYSRIMNFRFDLNSLIESDRRTDVSRVKEIFNRKVYFGRRKLEIETGAFSVLEYLLDLYHDMFIEFNNKNQNANDLSLKNLTIWKMFPVHDFGSISKDNYSQSCIILDYISGMTDNYALDLYRRFKGNSIGW